VILPDCRQINNVTNELIGTGTTLHAEAGSPIMCVCDHPDNLRGQPGLDFFKLVPTVWDETRVLSGALGEYLVMARRSGSDSTLCKFSYRRLLFHQTISGGSGFRFFHWFNIEITNFAILPKVSLKLKKLLPK
jgi:hypothetical protein